MKKIKILYGLVIALGIYRLVVFIFSIAAAIKMPSWFGEQFLITGTVAPISLIIGLVYIERGLFHCIKEGYFNTKNANKFKVGGLFILFYGFITIAQNTYTLLFYSYSSEFKLYFHQNISASIIVLIVGISLIVISDFLKKGNQLKEENKLTI